MPTFAYALIQMRYVRVFCATFARICAHSRRMPAHLRMRYTHIRIIYHRD